MSRWLAALALSVLALLACGDREAAGPAAQDAQAPAPAPAEGASDAAVDDALREQLSQLGYLDSAPEAASGGDGVVLHDRERAFPGFGLFTTRSRCLAELIDMDGRVVHAWQQQGCGFWSNAELQADGDLLVTAMKRTRAGARPRLHLVRMSWQGETLLDVDIGAHHDVEQLADGSILTLTQSTRRMPEVADAHVLDDAITLVSPEGSVLDAVSITELLLTRPEDVELRVPEASAGPGGLPTIDLIHANAVERIDRPDLVAHSPIYAPGNVLFCSQAQSLIGVVDLAERKLLWVWGRGELSGPHHPTLLRNGNILVFDNGIAHQRSRALELDPRSGEIVWSYQAPEPASFFTRSRGSVQRLPNGNTLLANSDHGIAFEVTPEGETVWEFRNPHLDARGHRATIVRMRRYPAMLVEALLSR